MFTMSFPFSKPKGLAARPDGFALSEIKMGDVTARIDVVIIHVIIIHNKLYLVRGIQIDSRVVRRLMKKTVSLK